MVIPKFKQASKEKLLHELNKAKSVNDIRALIKKYLPLNFRLSLTVHSPEFFLLFYLGFRLPVHQCEWIRLWAIQLLIELAPRDHGKSWIFSYGMPLWDIYSSYAVTNLKSVDSTMLQVSKTDEQAMKFGLQVRETIENNLLLMEDFGDIRDPQNWHKTRFKCIRESFDTVQKDFTYEYVGVLGGITGGHFRRIILDDILDDENTKTPERMVQIENWFWGTIWNMRETDTFYTVVGTRKNRRDIYSRLLESPLWQSNIQKAIIKYPMIQKHGQMVQGWSYITTTNRTIESPVELNPGEKIKDVKLLTDDFEVLWPPTLAVDNDGKVQRNVQSGKVKIFGWGIKELLLDRAGQGATFFDREKQNMVSSEEGSIFQRKWFAYFDTQELVYNSVDDHYYLTTDLEKGAVA